MRSWQARLRIHILYAAGKAFVEGVYTPVLSLGALELARFAMPTEAKQTKK
jgi:hypothetical protein